MVEYRCPKCFNTFHDQLRFCPYCGYEIHYPKNDWQTIHNKETFYPNNYNKSNGILSDIVKSIDDFGCGCLFLIFILFVAYMLLSHL